ncbi:hypothetical protein PFLA_a0202 [Pseudoalteromonas flavipulchra NCIMB 2033 = ATCC BAA-314]|nr:hypothetical protein [Pseudoalteromonas flavipulchra NCIMB 2033 = ATCC BAA-314]
MLLKLFPCFKIDHLLNTTGNSARMTLLPDLQREAHSQCIRVGVFLER